MPRPRHSARGSDVCAPTGADSASSSWPRSKPAVTRSARQVDDLAGGLRWRPAATIEMHGVDEVGPACKAGQHTVAILTELGYSPEAIDDLLARRIVAATS